MSALACGAALRIDPLECWSLLLLFLPLTRQRLGCGADLEVSTSPRRVGASKSGDVLPQSELDFNVRELDL